MRSRMRPLRHTRSQVSETPVHWSRPSMLLDTTRRPSRLQRRQPTSCGGMFVDIDADFYVMVDGDATYDPSAAPRMIRVLAEGRYDLVNAAQSATGSASFRSGRRFGNWLLTGLVGPLFGAITADMLSGYKAFSWRFVKTFPALSSGFEIETEIMIHALELRLPVHDRSSVREAAQ